MQRRDFLRTMAAGATLPLMPGINDATGQNTQTGKKNVLFIMTDQHSKFILGCHGDRVVQTPHMDRLAGNGIRFGNAYCHNPICVPSRMAMLTGKYGRDLDMPVLINGQRNTDFTDKTIGDYFQDQGYDVGLVGKMHFTGKDQHHGFPYRPFGDVYGDKDLMAADPKLQGVDIPGLVIGENDDGPSELALYAYHRTVMPLESFDPQDGGVTRIQTEDTWTWNVKEHTKRTLREWQDRPFFLMASFLNPHFPFTTPKKYWDMYKDNMYVPPFDAEIEKGLPQHLRDHRIMWQWDTMTNEEVRRGRAGYYGNVTFVDDSIGEILDTLKELGLEEDTIIVYTSDHGEMLGEYGCWNKMSFYDCSAGVPFMFSGPGIPQGQVNNELVEQVDLLPTLAELCNIPITEEIRGRSLVPLWSDADSNWREFLSCEYYDRPNYHPCRMVRNNRWKYNYHGYDKPQLFDMLNDPVEIVNLAEDSGYRRIAADMQAEVLRGWDPAAMEPIITQYPSTHGAPYEVAMERLRKHREAAAQ